MAKGWKKDNPSTIIIQVYIDKKLKADIDKYRKSHGGISESSAGRKAFELLLAQDKVGDVNG